MGTVQCRECERTPATYLMCHSCKENYCLACADDVLISTRLTCAKCRGMPKSILDIPHEIVECDDDSVTIRVLRKDLGEAPIADEGDEPAVEADPEDVQEPEEEIESDGGEEDDDAEADDEEHVEEFTDEEAE